MDNLKDVLATKGSKCKLQFSAKEKEYYEQAAGFTDEELDVFRMRSRGWSIVRISTEMESKYDRYFSVSTIEARIRSIKNKILRIL